jgi:hypothetical protein
LIAESRRFDHLPARLVLLDSRSNHLGNNRGANSFSYPMYQDFPAHNHVFSGILRRITTPAGTSFSGQTERASGEMVSGIYSQVLGVGLEDRNDRRSSWRQILGRLKPGVTPQQAKASMQVLFCQIIEQEAKGPQVARLSEYERQQSLKTAIGVKALFFLLAAAPS